MSRLFAGTAFDRPERCEACGKLASECRCLNLPERRKMGGGGGGSGVVNKGEVRLDSGLVLNSKTARAPEGQVARIRVEKRKGNRVVTVIAGLEHPENDLPGLCTELKRMLGVGGSVQGRTVELQGDHAERVGQVLEVEKGMKVRGK